MKLKHNYHSEPLPPTGRPANLSWMWMWPVTLSGVCSQHWDNGPRDAHTYFMSSTVKITWEHTYMYITVHSETYHLVLVSCCYGNSPFCWWRSTPSRVIQNWVTSETLSVRGDLVSLKITFRRSTAPTNNKEERSSNNGRSNWCPCP